MKNYQVKAWMTPTPIAIDADNNLSVAYHLMRINKVRRLPVVGKDERLLGIITWGDLREARPKEALEEQHGSEWESHFLAATLDVRQIMTYDPITVGPDDSMRQAARLMYEYKIGGLPVVDDGRVIGMITESDLFRFLIENFPAETE